MDLALFFSFGPFPFPLPPPGSSRRAPPSFLRPFSLPLRQQAFARSSCTCTFRARFRLGFRFFFGQSFFSFPPPLPFRGRAVKLILMTAKLSVMPNRRGAVSLPFSLSPVLFSPFFFHGTRKTSVFLLGPCHRASIFSSPSFFFFFFLF